LAPLTRSPSPTSSRTGTIQPSNRQQGTVPFVVFFSIIGICLAQNPHFLSHYVSRYYVSMYIQYSQYLLHSSILHPPSSILHPPSSILHPPSSILHPPSSIHKPPHPHPPTFHLEISPFPRFIDSSSPHCEVHLTCESTSIPSSPQPLHAHSSHTSTSITYINITASTLIILLLDYCFNLQNKLYISKKYFIDDQIFNPSPSVIRPLPLLIRQISPNNKFLSHLIGQTSQIIQFTLPHSPKNKFSPPMIFAPRP